MRIFLPLKVAFFVVVTVNGTGLILHLKSIRVILPKGGSIYSLLKAAEHINKELYTFEFGFQEQYYTQKQYEAGLIMFLLSEQ